MSKILILTIEQSLGPIDNDIQIEVLYINQKEINVITFFPIRLHKIFHPSTLNVKHRFIL